MISEKRDKPKLRDVDEMIESYRERYDEDLELGRKLRAFEIDIINCARD